MMIGPAPMIRMDARSARLGIAGLHQRDETIKQVGNVMRSWRGLGMTLKAESRLVSARQPLQRAVEQGDVGRAQVGRQGFLIHGKTVVLARNADKPGVKVLHGMVGAMVA